MRAQILRIWQDSMMLGAGLFLLLLRFVHLAADFPNGSAWADDAGRYTDEGWYAAAAIHHQLLGHWLVLGDFNPAVLIPGWPVLLSAVFQFTGTSIVAARSLDACFAVILIGLTVILVQRHAPSYGVVSFLLLTSSPILFFFSRLALLETPMLAFFLSAVLVAPRESEHSGCRTFLCALLFFCAVLVKTSALFLLPALLAYTVTAGGGWCSRTRRRVFGIGLLLALFCLAYAGSAMSSHLADARTFLEQNETTLQWRSAAKLIRVFYRGVTWVDPILFPLALAGTALSFWRNSDFWRKPLPALGAWWFGGYTLFAVLHFSADPRYFVVFVIPVTLLLVGFLSELARLKDAAYFKVASLLISVAVAWHLWSIGGHMLRPTYSMRDAFQQVKEIVGSPKEHRPIIFGHGAEQSTFFTGIEAIDDLGSVPLSQKFNRYHPEWLLAWSDGLQILQRAEVQARFRPVLAGSWKVMDQPGRSHLYLYRLETRTVSEK